MCASPSFLCVAAPRGIRLWRQNVAGRRSGRVTEHIKTHTHARTHTQSARWPDSSHTENIPVGASQPPTPIVLSYASKELKEEERKGRERDVRGEMETQKAKEKESKMRTKVCTEGQRFKTE